MRLGRRHKDAGSSAHEPVVVAAPEPSPAVTDSWTAQGAGPAQPAAPAPSPSPGDPPEAVVEGEAVEIPAEPHVYAAARPAAAFEPPVTYAAPAREPAAVPFPAAAEPVGVVAPGAEPDRVTPLGGAAEAFASGHGPTPAPAWPEGVQVLAAERPEVVVGAAFVGGILAAMILRRLGS